MINLSFQLNKVGREEVNKPKLSRGKETRIRAEINKIENRKNIREKSKQKAFSQKRLTKLTEL